jgi:site-specific recombinase XerD
MEQKVADLPASLVHSILQQAKKQGLRDYALAYVLFGAGLRPQEVVALERSHQIIDAHQHLLQVTQGAVREVPVNQWIMGKRYGSYTRNPLSQWLRSRKDDQSALFVNDERSADVRGRVTGFLAGIYFRVVNSGRSTLVTLASTTDMVCGNVDEGN